MSLQQLQGDTQQLMPASVSQNGPIFHGGLLQQPGPGMGIGGLGGYIDNGFFRNRLIERRDHIGNGIYGNPPPLMSIDGPPSHFQPSPMPVRPGPIFGGLQPMPQPAMPDYSSQFEKFGEQLTGFGDQMTGYQDALGSFNEQVGGMGKQFETITNRLDSVDKGLGSLGNQIASLENMQKAQPQEVMQPQRPAFNPFGFGGFGGLGSLFGRRY